MFKKILLTLALFFSTTLFANNSIYKVSVKKDFRSALHSIKKTLENENLYIISKADISGTLERMKGKLGKEYNKRGYEVAKSIIFCNPFYANDVMNLDPDMMALCPLKIMLMTKNGKTTALFVLPSKLAGNSAAKKVLIEVENKVKKALKKAGYR
jgi:uncharacterized protein (DUF302 family)